MENIYNFLMGFIISDDYPYEERQFYPENFNIDSVKRGIMGFTPRFGSLICRSDDITIHYRLCSGGYKLNCRRAADRKGKGPFLGRWMTRHDDPS